MANILTNLFGNKSEIEKLEQNGYGEANFDIATTPLFYNIAPSSQLSEGSTRSSSKNVVYRTDTGQELGVHGPKYLAVNHKDMIDTSRATLERSPLNLTDIQEEISVANDGAMCFIRHTLPEHKFTTPGGDEAQLTTLHLSSLNGVWSYLASFGANQGACMNHQIFVSGAVTVYKARHTKNLDIKRSAAIIGTAMETFHDEVELWHKWSDEALLTLDAFKLFANAANSKFVEGYCKEHPDATVTELLTLPSVYNNTSLIYLWDKYAKQYCPSMGRNYWAAYNTLTDWSTHAPAARESSQKNIAYISHQRAETGRGVIQAHFPMQLAA